MSHRVVTKVTRSRQAQFPLAYTRRSEGCEGKRPSPNGQRMLMEIEDDDIAPEPECSNPGAPSEKIWLSSVVGV